MCDHELDQKEQNRIAKYQKEAHLPAGKTLSSFDASSLTSFDWPRFEALSRQTDWLGHGHNVFLFGASGLGKTHLAAALGHSLTLRGKRVLFIPTTALVQRLQQAHRGLTLAQELMKLDRYQLLILDDVGYVRKDDQETHVLFELITHRYERVVCGKVQELGFVDFFFNGDDRFVRTLKVLNDFAYAAAVSKKGRNIPA